ncbi:MAG: repeat-containing protein [Pedosphaera sp.]|nr:repeat-containing protein [Pedosphaera sp.]
MNESAFWSLIETTKEQSLGDANRQVELLQKSLESLSEKNIVDFDCLFDVQMDKSYTRDLWAAAYIINGGCSDDGFDYFRAWLISRGQQVFSDALKDPETLIDEAEPDVELELIMYAAANAYKTKLKKRLPSSVRPARKLTGDEWEEDEEALQKKYPKLFARFWAPNGGDEAPSGEMDLGGALAMLQQLTGVGATGTSAGDPNALYMQASLLSLNGSDAGNMKKAAALLIQAAEQDHAEAQYLLGLYYQEGKGVRQDYAEAAKWFVKSAKLGNADAAAALGLLYQEGLGMEQDHAKALKWYRQGAEGGSSDAEFGLGFCYSEGMGVKENKKEALKWFIKAAEQGHEVAAYNLGTAYTHGHGAEIDHAEAARWFAQAAEAGSAGAQYSLDVLYEKGHGVPQDLAKAAELYEAAAERDDARAQSNLGLLYTNGKGVPQDFQKAVEWYHKAIENGNLVAASNLAVLYQRGHGVPQDSAEAVKLYRQCADAGLMIGQFNLGTMYERGLGVPQDYKEALKWYHLAAEQGSAAAQNNIADFYENGRGVKQDYALAAKWYRKSAENGISVAQRSLGKFYRDGRGVKQEYREAAKWFQLAVEHGLTDAQKDLDALYEAGHVKRPKQTKVKPAAAPVKKATPAPAAAPDSAGTIVTPQAAAKRALCLRALIRRGVIEAMMLGAKENSLSKSAVEEAKVETKKINQWLKDEELWEALSVREKALLKVNTGAWPVQALTDASWRAEALGVITWALQLSDRILPYDEQNGDQSAVNSLEILFPTTPFVSSARLRPDAEIAAARETAEAWLWRARTTRCQKQPDKYPPPAGWTYEKIIFAAVEHSEKQGLFKAIDGDYPAFGKPYRELTEKEWSTMSSIASERLYGLNWLCAHADNWDLVKTGT